MSICPSFTHSEGRKQDALEATKHLHETDGEGTSDLRNDADSESDQSSKLEGKRERETVSECV